eukprot:2860803-Ditylum_brightwellii.AAC.1
MGQQSSRIEERGENGGLSEPLVPTSASFIPTGNDVNDESNKQQRVTICGRLALMQSTQRFQMDSL